MKKVISIILADALDLVNRQQEQLEAAANGQETLQKALAEKDREVERLTAEKDQLIKTFGECQAEAIKEFAERLKRECLIDRGYEILYEGTIDNLVKEMAGEV